MRNWMLTTTKTHCCVSRRWMTSWGQDRLQAMLCAILAMEGAGGEHGGARVPGIGEEGGLLASGDGGGAVVNRGEPLLDSH